MSSNAARVRLDVAMCIVHRPIPMAAFNLFPSNSPRDRAPKTMGAKERGRGFLKSLFQLYAQGPVDGRLFLVI